jgi:CDP-glucose 4,6-dehydratase
MEELVMTHFAGVYRRKRVLITGHTGFKGSWLALWLTELGADVIGVSLPQSSNSIHWALNGLSIDDRRLNICDPSLLKNVLNETKPDIVFHLAAQALVRKSYQTPLETWSTNVLGTANLLDACRNTPSVQAIVVITTDKCYENQEWPWGYRENDSLGGFDPYSASKAGAELVASSYRNSFFNEASAPLLATARAGNVIGGGDWSEDRLIPDLVRAIESNHSLEIRSPDATRPWQHVLESLSGYLLLGQKLLSGSRVFAEAWNFGPEKDGNRTVAEVLGLLNNHWSNMKWHVADKSQLHEANLLYLDSAKAQKLLGWQPVWSLDMTLEKTAQWYQAWLVSKDVISRKQLTDYVESAANAKIEWATP